MIEPKTVARSWLNKARDEQDHFDRFVYLWFAFNALYNDFLNDKQSEFGAIRSLIKSERYRLENHSINRILNARSVAFFKRRVIRDCRGNGRDTYESIVRIQNVNTSPKEKLINLLRILYHVRCNLFHGNKMYGRDSDNDVMENAANVLMIIVETYIA